MRIVRAVLLSLNTACGIIFVLMALTDFKFHWGTVIILFFSILFLVGGCVSVRWKLPGWFSYPSTSARSYFGLFIINLIGFLIILASTPLHIEVRFLVYMTGGSCSFFLDFHVLGLELVRNIERRTSEEQIWSITPTDRLSNPVSTQAPLDDSE